MSSGTALELLSLTGLTDNTFGEAELILPHGNNFIIALTAGLTSGSGGPSLDVTVQHSVDGIHWVTIATFAQVTSSTDSHELIHINSATTHLAQRVRARAVFTGTLPRYTGSVVLYYQNGD